jgi:hypothetical protein
MWLFPQCRQCHGGFQRVVGKMGRKYWHSNMVTTEPQEEQKLKEEVDV